MSARALAGLALAWGALGTPALAQSASPPLFNQVDANGVDLFTGDFFFSMIEGRIGSGDGELALVRNWAGAAGWTDNWSGVLYFVSNGGNDEVVVEFGSYSDRFAASGSTYTPVKADGATLTTAGAGYLYTARDGTQISFRDRNFGGTYTVQGPACQRSPSGQCAFPSSIRRPNGMTYILAWDIVKDCASFATPTVCESGEVYPRFRGVSTSANYSFTISYATDTPGGDVPVANWYVRTGAQFTNLDGAPASPPTVAYSAASSTVTEVTDMGGQVWRLANGGAGGRLSAIRRPGAGSDTTTISYDGNGSVSSVTREGVTTSYSRAISGSGGSMTVTDAAGNEAIYLINLTRARITSVFDTLERTTSFGYDDNGRPTGIQWPEGNGVAYTYDARGNITEVRQREKGDTGDTGDDIVINSTYPSSCSNPVTCNQPTSITDPRGHTTDFTYDAAHGGLITATGPAPSGSGDRPETRIAYSQVTAVTGQPVYLPIEVSTCASGSVPNCVGTASEARTVTTYDSDNLRVTSVTGRSGDNNASLTSAYGYDQIGNLTTIDGPLAGSGDTTRLRYDGARRMIGMIGPDPDGAGGNRHRAERRTFTNGLLTATETGVADSQSDAHWAAFTAAQRIELDYDAHARPIQQRLTSGGTIYSVAQTSYDAMGRVQCRARRMNPAEFASPTSDACALDTQGTGANDFGPDRITRTYYDAGSRVTQVRTAYGVSGQEANEVSLAYRPNGQVEYATDANGNVTRYYYDEHDRVWHTLFPDPSTGAVNYDDYERYSYDLAGNLTGVRRRDGTIIGYSYDALGRMTEKDVSGAEPAVAYSYDLMGRLLAAATASPSHTLTTTYDALGRVLSQAGPQGTASYGYDSAGRRATLAYPGSGLTIGYVYDTASQLTQIRENPAGANSLLAAYTYDSLGRRTYLTRGNGAETSYGYDAVSRLSQMIHNATGTTHDLTLGYSYNPAGQIARTTRSNDLYAWGGHHQASVGYTPDRLNRYSAIGGVTPTYDARGNLTSAGSTTYGYTGENLLASASGGATLAYDPAMRLYETAGGSTTRLAYDGESLIAEYDGSNTLQRRYVHGAGIDEPLVRFDYDGSGAVIGRSWHHADERGSVIALSDGSGNVTQINSYDEYGMPASGNAGRFQYTGQQWLAELALHHYRARAYAPGQGRFLQTDPIGYAGGMNLYTYVRNDAINRVDPSGLEDKTIVVIADPWWRVSMQQITREQMLAELRLAQATSARGNGSNERGDRQCPAVPASRPIGGRGRNLAGFFDMPGALAAYDIADLAFKAARDRFPNVGPVGTIRDAYRHFYWMYGLTRAIGPDRARAFGNANEVSGRNSPAEQKMDTFNNETAVIEASDPRNYDRPTSEVAEEMIRNGCLRTIR